MKKVNGAVHSPYGPVDRPQVLLDLLRRKLGRPDLEWGQAPRPVTGPLGGHSANATWRVRLRDAPDAWSGPLALRVHLGPFAGSSCRVEALVQAALSEQGFPVPRIVVFEEDDPEMGAPFLVTTWLAGWNGMDVLVAGVPAGAILGALVGRPALFGAVALSSFGFLTARLMHRLHALPPEPVVRAIEQSGDLDRLDPVSYWLSHIRDETRRLGLTELEPAHAWLVANRRPDGRKVVCHGDLHPGNLVVSPGSVGVVDWEGVVIAEPEYDLATTHVRLCAQSDPVGLPPVVDGVARAVLFVVARVLYGAHAVGLRLLGARFDRRRLDYMRALELAVQLVRVGQVAAGEASGAVPLSQRGVRRMERWLRRLTGEHPGAAEEG